MRISDWSSDVCSSDLMAHRQQQRYAARLIAINEKEIGSLGGRMELFAEGNEYLDPTHPYAYDLDIFGKNSLFQLINRTACLSGEALLAKRLTALPEKDRKSVVKGKRVADM